MTHSTPPFWQKFIEIAFAVLAFGCALSGSFVALPFQIAFTILGISLLRTDSKWDLKPGYRKACLAIYVAAAITALILLLIFNPSGGLEKSPWEDTGWRRS